MAIELKALVGRFKLDEDPLPAIVPARSTQVHVTAVANRRVRA